MKHFNLLIISISLLFVISCSRKEPSYVITGEIKNPEVETISLLTYRNSDTLATTYINDGTYQINGKVEKPQRVWFRAGKHYVDFVLENDKYSIIDAGLFSYAKGGEINSLVNGYYDIAEYIDAKNEASNPAIFENVDIMDKEAITNARTEFRKLAKIEWSIKEKYQKSIIEGDYPILAKVFTLMDFQDWENYPAEKRIELLDLYQKEIGENDLLVQLKSDYERVKKINEVRNSVKPGNPFKEVISKDIHGNDVRLSSTIENNKYTLLEFWASWCGPCRAEFPHLKNAYREFNSKGFEIFALSIDEKKEDWQKALEAENTPWINVAEFQGFKSEIVKQYAVTGVPSSFLINNKGIIVAEGNDVRGFALDKKLKELFK